MNKIIKDQIDRLKPSATLAINEESNKLKKDGKKVYKFGFGQSPFPVPKSIVSALKINADKHTYLPMQGLVELRESISKYLLKKTGVNYPKENIIITPGSKEAMLESFKIASGDYVFIADSGRKFNFNDFWKLYENIEKYDLVSGLRINRKDQIYRIILTKLFNLFLKLSLNSKFKDCDSGFKIYKNTILQKIIQNEVVNPNFISAELCLKIQYSGYSFIEIPVEYFQRDEVSKASALYKIPILILNFLLNFFKFKTQLKKINSQ